MMPHIGEYFIAPCWHMKVEHEKDDCNMVLSQDLSEQDVKLGVRVDLPHLENSEPVTKGQALVLYRPKPPVVVTPVEELQDVKRRKKGKVQG